MISRLALFAALTLTASALTACEEPAPPGEFDLTFNSQPFSGTTGVSCKINTSYPDGDPLKGKFFVSVTDYEDRGFSMLLHFMELTAAPSPGSYDVATELDLQASYEDEDEQGGQFQGEFPDGTVTVDDEAPGFRVTFSTGQLTGSVYCPGE